MKQTWWKSGSYNALCDICGFKFKNTELSKRWDGLMVCRRDNELRHPQELIRPVPDQTKLPWTRPDPAKVSADITAANQSDIVTSTDTYVAPVCTPWGLQPIPGLAQPGCVQPGTYDIGYRHTFDTTHNA